MIGLTAVERGSGEPGRSRVHRSLASRSAAALAPKRDGNRRRGDPGRVPSLRLVVISRTPLRISFVGGGTDLPDFYERHGGAVVSTTVDKWIHVIVAPRF